MSAVYDAAERMEADIATRVPSTILYPFFDGILKETKRGREKCGKTIKFAIKTRSMSFLPVERVRGTKEKREIPVIVQLFYYVFV